VRGGLIAVAAGLLLAACTASAEPTASPGPSLATPPVIAASPMPAATYLLHGNVGALDVFTCRVLANGLSTAQIVVRDDRGTIIAAGQMGERLGAAGWAFQLDVPETAFYTVTVGDEWASMTYPLADLIDAEWEIFINVECPD